MEPILQVETDRLLLRPLVVDDVGPHYERWLNDERVTRFLESRFVSHSMDSIRSYVESIKSDPDIVFAAISEKPNRHIGNIKLGPIHPVHRRGDVGILIGEPDCWGRGYATEAILALKDFAFRDLKLAKLAAGSYKENAASIRAFERAGFVVEGVLGGHVKSGDTRDDLILFGLVNPEFHL
jgi:ribosomal-protein-alanine N-acetyltransferase